MSKSMTAIRDQYVYATGRIRALEMNLLDASQYSRLYDARSVDDINRVLSECGYPQTADPEESLSRELISTYELIDELMPDQGYVDAFLLQHDFHNIKTVLKYLLPAWSVKSVPGKMETLDTAEDIPGADEADDLPVINQTTDHERQIDVSDVHHLFLLPSRISPGLLFTALTERQSDLIPEWAYNCAVKAIASYQSTYDASDVDLTLDHLAFEKICDTVSALGDADFALFIRRKIDLTNLSMVLRSRHMQSGLNHLKKSLISNGTLPVNELASYYDQSIDLLTEYIRQSDYASLAEAAATYGEKGGASRFSLETDNYLMKQIRKAKWVLSGPEVPLAYLFARDMEIKNIRIIAACVRNGIPMHLARDLAREQYLDWR